MKKKAFITGISGQDGSYLAELLVEKDYDVYGIIRRHSTAESQETRIDHLVSKNLIKTDYGDLLDNSSLCRLMALIQPDEIYNLGAQSHVRISFDIPQFTMQTNMIGTLNLLEAYRSICPKAKFYQASSSEMFGNEIDKDGFQRLALTDALSSLHTVSSGTIETLIIFLLLTEFFSITNHQEEVKIL